MSATFNADGMPLYPYMVAKEFPDLPEERLVDRRNVLETIERMFAESPTIFLEGEEGAGATTLLAQFAHHLPDRTFSLFVKPASRITYSPEYLRLVLADQFSQFLDGRPLNKEVISQQEYNGLVFRVRRRVNKRNPVFITVDGIHKITGDDSAITSVFRDVLPVGPDGFKFLIAGEQQRLEKYLAGTPSKYFKQLRFSLAETTVFMAGSTACADEIKMVHTLCDGVPGKLASVRRLVSSGHTVAQLFESDVSNLPNFIKLELAPIDTLSDHARYALAVLTFSNRKLSGDEIKRITPRCEDPAISEMLSVCKFLFVATPGAIEFVSDGHRRWAAKTLAPLKNSAISSHIEHLIQDPTSHAALTYLPTYYQQLDQAQELIALLNSDHFTQLLGATESIASLRTRAELGLKSAASLRKATDVFAFAVKRSIFASMAKAEGSKSHIRALVALGDHNTALRIAHESTVNEERLAFMSAYAKQCKDSTNTVDEQVLAVIKETANKMDFAQLGEVAIDLASEIVHVLPDLALSIVDAALAENTPNDRDAAYVRLSLESGLNQKNKSSKSSFQSSRGRISDEKLQVFLSSVVALVLDYSADEIIEVSKRLENHRQLGFLGQWVQQHKKDSSAIEVAEYGLNLMIDNATYSPKMRDFSALAVALPFGTDTEKLRQLVSRFDSQRGVIKENSGSADSIILQMTLAHAEWTFEKSSCCSRIIDVYYELCNIADVDTKLAALASFFKCLSDIDQDGSLEKEHGFKAVARQDIVELLTSVLELSADHFLIAKKVLVSLALSDFPTAMNVASSLNVEHRRDEAFGEIVSSIQESELDNEYVSFVIQALGEIQNQAYRQNVFANFLRNISTRKQQLPEESIGLLERELPQITLIVPRARSLLALIKLRIRSQVPLNPTVYDAIKSQVAMMDSTFDRASLAFDVCAALAKTDRELATEFFELATAQDPIEQLSSSSFNYVLAWCLALTSRAFGGAMRANSFDDRMLSRFRRLIQVLSSTYMRVDALSDLACRAWAAGCADIGRVLVDDIVVLIDETQRTNSSLAHSLKIRSFPAIYVCRTQLAIDYARTLTRVDLERAVLDAFDLLVHKAIELDPDIQRRKRNASLTYSEAQEACSLILYLTGDSGIFSAVNGLCVAINSKTNSLNFTANQKADLGERLRQAYKEKLPDQRNIRHDGYLILCDANVATLQSHPDVKLWQDLIDRARKISNLADRGFVLAELAALLPPKLSTVKTSLQKEAVDVFATVPSSIDRINRLIGISEGATGSAVVLAKQSLKAALMMTLQGEDEVHSSNSRRKIIDIADKLSPDFADELSELLDHDAARSQARIEVRDQLKMLSVKKKLSDARDVSEITRNEMQHLPEAAWKNVSGLIEGRLETKSPELLIDYLAPASALTLDTAFPVLSWFIENSTRKYSHVKQGSHIEALCESLLLTTELASNVMLKVASRGNTARYVSPIESTSATALLGLSNRAEALRFIGEWLSGCKDDVLLCDPFFAAEERDLEFLRLILANCPQVDVTIITSRTHLSDKGVQTEEAFLTRWYEVCDQVPPSCRIIGASVTDGAKAVIHDRWLICGDRGLRLGTSFNGIGTGKLSEISRLNDGELIVTSKELQKFVSNQRVIEGTRVSYTTYTI